MKLRVVDDETEVRVEEIPSFELVYRRHARFVATIVMRLLGRNDDLDDVVHDTFLQVRRALPRLRDPNALEPWLATITVRVVRRRLRRARLRQVVFRTAVEADEIASTQLSADEYDTVHGAYARLSTIPTDQRIAWILRRVHGAQLSAVAQMCGCSLATVKRRITAADRLLNTEDSP